MSEPDKQFTSMQRAQMRAPFYATKPTGLTVFLRTFFPWQVWRLVRINLRMLSILHRSHKQL